MKKYARVPLKPTEAMWDAFNAAIAKYGDFHCGLGHAFDHALKDAIKAGDTPKRGKKK